jgi:hypothetical protein
MLALSVLYARRKSHWEKGHSKSRWINRCARTEKGITKVQLIKMSLERWTKKSILRGCARNQSVLCCCHPSHTIRYQSIPIPMICCPSHTTNILMSPLPNDQLQINYITKIMLFISNYIILMSTLPHDQLPIKYITNIMLSISLYKHPYITPPTRSVTNQFHYQCFAVHITL